MAIIVTYDIPSRHVEFKKHLFQMGYKDQIPLGDKAIFLPNTTIYHPTKGADAAVKECQLISTNLSVKLERCVSTQWGPDWSAIYGEPFKQ